MCLCLCPSVLLPLCHPVALCASVSAALCRCPSPPLCSHRWAAHDDKKCRIGRYGCLQSCRVSAIILLPLSRPSLYPHHRICPARTWMAALTRLKSMHTRMHGVLRCTLLSRHSQRARALLADMYVGDLVHTGQIDTTGSCLVLLPSPLVRAVI